MSDGGGDDFYADYDPSAYNNNNNRYDSSRSPRDTNSRGRGGYNNSNRGHGNAPYSRDTSRDNSNVDERAVMQLIAQRTDARRSGDFPAADAIRERLMSEFQVGVDDPGGTWRTGVSSSGSGRKFIGRPRRDDDRGRGRSRDDYGGGGRGGRGVVGGRGRGRGRGGRGGRGGRDLGPNGHDYRPSADQGPNTSPYTEIEIHRLIAQRLQAKFARNFQEADDIQGTLAEGGVYVHDKRKEWRADGVHIVNSVSTYGKSPYSEEDGSSNDDDALISKLVDERQKCKMMRQYDKADTIRDGLLDRYNVVVDDRAKQWSVGGDFGPEANEQRDAFNEFANRDYLQSKSSAIMSNEDIDHIQERVNVRTRAKKDRDFATADEIRDVLSNEYDVTILDKHKLWSVGGIFEETGQKPPGVYVRVGDDRRDPNGFKSPLSQEDENAIMKMIATRYKAKRARDFDTSDGIRDELVERFGVRIDDKSNEWRIMSRHGGGGGDDYAQVGEHNLSARDVEVVDAKLKERSACKRDREYEEADAIRDLLMDRFGVLVDDRNKEWSVLPGSVDDFIDDETASAAAEGQEADEDDGDEDANQEEVEEEVEDIPTEETLAKLTIPLLKEKLREAGLPVSGKKAELVARLLA